MSDCLNLPQLGTWPGSRASFTGAPHAPCLFMQEALKREQAAARAKQDAEKAAFDAKEAASRAAGQQRAEAARKARAAEMEDERLRQEQLQR